MVRSLPDSKIGTSTLAVYSSCHQFFLTVPPLAVGQPQGVHHPVGGNRNGLVVDRLPFLHGPFGHAC